MQRETLAISALEVLNYHFEQINQSSRYSRGRLAYSYSG
jgi:hypothetical protein